jgi:hypothetical protein
MNRILIIQSNHKKFQKSSKVIDNKQKDPNINKKRRPANHKKHKKIRIVKCFSKLYNNINHPQK